MLKTLSCVITLQSALMWRAARKRMENSVKPERKKKKKDRVTKWRKMGRKPERKMGVRWETIVINLVID